MLTWINFSWIPGRSILGLSAGSNPFVYKEINKNTVESMKKNLNALLLAVSFEAKINIQLILICYLRNDKRFSVFIFLLKSLAVFT